MGGEGSPSVQGTHGQSQSGGRIEGGRWGWLVWGDVVGEKWRQLYLNSNKKKERKKTKPPEIMQSPLLQGATSISRRLLSVQASLSKTSCEPLQASNPNTTTAYTFSVSSGVILRRGRSCFLITRSPKVSVASGLPPKATRLTQESGASLIIRVGKEEVLAAASEGTRSSRVCVKC